MRKVGFTKEALAQVKTIRLTKESILKESYSVCLKGDYKGRKYIFFGPKRYEKSTIFGTNKYSEWSDVHISLDDNDSKWRYLYKADMDKLRLVQKAKIEMINLSNNTIFEDTYESDEEAMAAYEEFKKHLNVELEIVTHKDEY